MYHPTTRVLTVLELLQARPGLSGAAIAVQLEVDRRTVRRYLTMLQDLGIPIETMRGPHGGYRLRPGFKLPPLMLTDAEALAVTLSLIATERQGLSIDPLATAGARAKIERVLPESLQERLQAVRDVVAFQANAPASYPDGAMRSRMVYARAPRSKWRCSEPALAAPAAYYSAARAGLDQHRLTPGSSAGGSGRR